MSPTLDQCIAHSAFCTFNKYALTLTYVNCIAFFCQLIELNLIQPIDTCFVFFYYSHSVAIYLRLVYVKLFTVHSHYIHIYCRVRKCAQHIQAIVRRRKVTSDDDATETSRCLLKFADLQNEMKLIWIWPGARLNNYATHTKLCQEQRCFVVQKK